MGFIELNDNLADLANKIENLNGTRKVPVVELLTATFMVGCSRFNSAEELFKASGFKIDSQKDLEAIPDIEWDAFIKQNTTFGNWQEMLSAAAANWTKGKLGL